MSFMLRVGEAGTEIRYLGNTCRTRPLIFLSHKTLAQETNKKHIHSFRLRNISTDCILRGMLTGASYSAATVDEAPVVPNGSR